MKASQLGQISCQIVTSLRQGFQIVQLLNEASKFRITMDSETNNTAVTVIQLEGYRHVTSTDIFDS